MDQVGRQVEPLDATRRMTLLGTEVIAHTNRHLLVAEVGRLERRGEIRRITNPAWNRDLATWEVRFARLKDPLPVWLKPVVIVGAVTTIAAGFAGLLVWLLASLAAVPWAAVAGGALVGLVAVKLIGRSAGGKRISGTFEGTIR